MSTPLMFMLVAMVMVEGKLIDIRKEVANVLKQHNKERSSRQLKAADMLEMTWDDELARQAGQYSERCRYQYPDGQEFDVGSNLYYQLDFVHGNKPVHRLVNTAMKSWTRSKDYFVYGPHCDRACSYAQMVYARTDKVGCALSTCNDLDTGVKKEAFASMFVCFYSPRQSLLNALPYKNGFMCSECPAESICRNGLCSKLGTPGYEALPAYLQDSPEDRIQAQQGHVGGPDLDALEDNDQHYLTVSHNRLRDSSNMDHVEWDHYLQKWAEYVINCKIDYPGPAHAYTNFHRLDQGTQVYTVVYEWSREGDNTNVELDHGCRTPRDSTRCNHYTNIVQPNLTSMGCAAKDCKDSTRQLVCIYDNKVDRELRRPLQSYTSTRRQKRRDNKRKQSVSH
ncbi:hypothetical protein BsWGS_20763 [Bradybaena similaris]